MDNLVVMNKEQTFGEIVVDMMFDTFKYDYEQNNERALSLTVYKSTEDADIFDCFINENLLIWKGQIYVIKSTSLKYEEGRVMNEVVAKHISMEFQNHNINKDISNEQLNDIPTSDDDDKSSSSEDDKGYKLTLREYLKKVFKGNQQGFHYEVKGKFTKKVAIDDFADKNGLEAIMEGVEHYGYIFFANNKKFIFYGPSYFYEHSDEVLIYKYNNSMVDVTTTTTEQRTYIKGYGKKKTEKETKNYTPFKPDDLTFSGKFIKEGTWKTENIGDSYSATLNAKWGNESLIWNLKKMSKGGNVEIFLDGKSKGEYSCYSKNAETKRIVLANSLPKGKHTVKVVFKSKRDGVNYKKSNPCMYVGTKKSTVFNLTAVLKGKDIYHVEAEYKSPYYDKHNPKIAPTLYDDTITTKKTLLKKLKAALNDEPTIELTTNYIGDFDNEFQIIKPGKIKENHIIRFVHKPLGINTDLKVVKITENHPLMQQPSEISFSNSKKDIIKWQQQMNQRIKNVNNLMKKGFKTSTSDDRIDALIDDYDDIVGSVLVDE
ncbi:prophage endopeptidase tail family protein [Staphylococcus capitis]|uniref:prophage endopeptidase tail family protein n=1 Tax=Staphylococcus capitis TaxID=29388 RepID=UPI00367B5F07